MSKKNPNEYSFLDLFAVDLKQAQGSRGHLLGYSKKYIQDKLGIKSWTIFRNLIVSPRIFLKDEDGVSIVYKSFIEFLIKDYFKRGIKCSAANVANIIYEKNQKNKEIIYYNDVEFEEMLLSCKTTTLYDLSKKVFNDAISVSLKGKQVFNILEKFENALIIFEEEQDATN